MNTPEKKPEEYREYGDIIACGHLNPSIVHALQTYDVEKFVKENPEMGQMINLGYPLLFHIIVCLMGHMSGKKILEIGGGATHGPKNLEYLRQFTDTVDENGFLKNHTIGIDARQAHMDDTGKLISCNWNEIGTIGINADCIFHHRIGPISDNPLKLSKITDEALNPWGYYIGFRRLGGEEEPIDKQFFLNRPPEQRYIDGSFSFRFKSKKIGNLTRLDEGYHVTILRKPLPVDGLKRQVQDGTDDILAR